MTFSLQSPRCLRAAAVAAFATLASCSFPSVEVTPGGNGGAATTTSGPLASSGDTSSTTTSGSTGQGGGGPTSTSTSTGTADGGGPSTSGGGDGGRPSTSGGGDGGGSSGGGAGGRPSTSGGGDGGQSTSGGGDGGGIGGASSTTSTGGGGAGGAPPDTCPETGCDACEGDCPSGATPTDCDNDGDDNDNDCQPCNGDVHAGQMMYFAVPYTMLGGGSSFDYNCAFGDETDLPYDSGGCNDFTAELCPDRLYVELPECGEEAPSQACDVSGGIVGVTGTCTGIGGISNELVACH